MPDGHFSGNHPSRTVKDFLRQPKVIEKTLMRMNENQFLAETLFQRGFNAEGGAVAYQESVNPFMEGDDNDDLAIAEGSEYPELYMAEEQQRAGVRKYALATWLTFEDVKRNQLGQLARATTRMRNTMIKHLDKVVMNMLKTTSKITEHPSAADWNNPATTTIIDDLLASIALVEDQKRSGGEAYEADTLVMNSTMYTHILRNAEIQEMMKELPESRRPEFGATMGELAGLAVLKSPWVPDDVAFVLQRRVIGGIADEDPLQLKPIERDESRDRYWLRAKRTTAAFLTDPKAIIRITGIKA